MANEGPTPAPILQIVTGLWAAGVLKCGLDLGGPYDAVFLGHILHNYNEETCRKTALGEEFDDRERAAGS